MVLYILRYLKSLNSNEMKCLLFHGYFCFLLAISSVWFISESHAQCVEDESSAAGNSTTECINGVCVEGKCECDQGWTGAQCEECSGRVLLDSDTGFISDGMKDYAKKRECSWIIQPKSRNATIRLRVLEFATECGWDYLYIYDGDSASAPLLASFNGLLYTNDKDTQESDFFGPEVVASSGTAFVHFFSDVEYVMKGFNISYTVDSCPHNCSDHGVCNVSDGAVSCNCESGWSGDACQFESCPNNCSSADGQGSCLSSIFQESCNCTDGYQGADCSSTIPAKEGFWYNMNFQSEPSSVFASSHSGIRYQDTLWVYGGIKFSELSSNGTFDVYNFTTTRWDSVEPTSTDFPTLRYGHSMVVYDDRIIMFGGRDVLSSEALNEVWEFDISNRSWTKMTPSDNFSATFGNNGTALKLWGHTATFVKLSTGQNVMLVTFGFHTLCEYSGFIFEYDLDVNTWSKINTIGAKIEAAFGHSTTWDPVNNVCYIHGGIVFLKAKKYGITDSLISYDVNGKNFVALRPSGLPRYFHTGLLIDGMLLVYGGCTHNDSDRSFGALCFSPSFMAYSVACDSWHTLPSLDDTSDPDRYGHITAAVDGSEGDSKTMVVHGGYDGRILNSFLFYKTGSCDAYSENETTCTGVHHNGIACQWNNTRCIPAKQSLMLSGVSCLSNTQNLASYCSKLQSCASCANAGQNCFWCDKKCTAEKCEEVDCPTDESVYCERFRSCGQCEQNENCQWRLSSCKARTDNGTANCPESCGMQKSCSDCVGDNCMWCPNKNLCVSTTSYVAQFPYGECMKWINENSQCESTEGCASHRTCSDCLNDPFCGWCDNGQKTGIGTCIKGSFFQPQISSDIYNVLSYNRPTTSNSTCQNDRWYFVQCPLCQCNGHSTCVTNTSQCISCQNNTTGDQCERCSDGYFGKATNGGTCEPCECYDRADFCDHTSGKCFCNTKGVEGDKCDRCDNSGKYYGDPANNGTCFYRLLINYSFTFSLSNTHDQYITAINFENTPAEQSDAELSFESQVPCNVRLTVYRIVVQKNSDRNSSRVNEVSYVHTEEIEVASVLNVKKFSHDFSGSLYGFGDTSTNATIRIYVSNITVPTLIKVALVQRNQYLLMLLLILFSCFLVLLLLTALGWKLKLLLDACRQRRQREEQLEQMAARPFATVYLVVGDYQASSYIPTTMPDDKVDVMSEETHAAGQASLISVLLRMPSGDGSEKSDADAQFTPLAFGTALSHKCGAKDEASVRKNTASKSKKLKILFKRGRHPRTSTNRSEAVRASVRSQHSQPPAVVCRTDTAVPPVRSRDRRSKRGQSSFSSLRSRSISPSNEPNPTNTQSSTQNTARGVQPTLPCKDSRSEGVALGGSSSRKDETNSHTTASNA